MTVNRPSGRAFDELRPVRITRGFTRHAQGSVLVEFGDTQVICTACIEQQVPRFLRGKGSGWVTAEYGMLPGATHSRVDREAVRGGQGGRTVEIQRLIGRAIRACVNMKRLGERTVRLDCDVIQVSGGSWGGVPVVDLDNAEDSTADTDMNVVMLASGGFVEIQGTAEKAPFVEAEFSEMLRLARQGAEDLIALQRTA